MAVARLDGRDPIRADREVLYATLVSQAALAHERLLLEDRHRTNCEVAGSLVR
jgi:two-component system sensor histidine kinase KdpD